MKGRKPPNGQRRRPNGAVRLPRDYPWVVASHLLGVVAEFMPAADVKRFETLTRARDIDAYMQLASDWSLPQCNVALSSGLTLENIKVRLLLGSVLRKYPFEGNSQGRVNAALDNLVDGERVCSFFNRKGWHQLTCVDGKPSKQLTRMREFISRVLGPLNMDSVLTTSRHGPGSSTSSVKGNISSYFKYSEWPYHVTSDATSHAKRLILSDERWLSALEEVYWEKWKSCDDHVFLSDQFWDDIFHVVPGNRITTVPKDYHKDRTIAIEPTLNLMLQLGVDGHIRKQLKRWRIDLDTQFHNAEAARLGSIGSNPRKPATIDLKNASDTVSLRLMKLVLPRDWYDYVCALRSPKGVLPDGRRLRFRKLSSMGNGYTFAIEALVFASVCYSQAMEFYGMFPRGEILIIGDDIIVPEEIACRVVHGLEACGFAVNLDKTFLEGNVKESCGADWLHGRNVRPVFLKRRPENVLDLYSQRNQLFRWCNQHLAIESLGDLDHLFTKWIPKQFYCEGPLSDQEFSGYFHTKKPGVFRHWTYWFRSAEWRPARQKGPSFPFRKLMADLRGTHYGIAEDWFRDLSKASGCAFEVVSRGRGNLCMNNKRRSPVWTDAYCSPDANHRH